MSARIYLDFQEEKLLTEFKQFVRDNHDGKLKGYYAQEVRNALITYMAYHDYKDYREKAQKLGLWPVDVGEGMLDKRGYIYFISDGDCVKIGFSTNPQTRLGNIQVGTPKKLELLCKINALESHELAIQNLFSDYLERGEWYRLEGKLKGFLEDLNE